MVIAHPARVVAPGPPAFELHTLGWRAFQDLCGAVVRTMWGQSAQAFADSNDAGRDGAFYGIWHDPPASTGLHDLLRGPFVLQCKHTKKAGSTLSAADLEDEFDKVPSLVERGLCRSYVLMTNARVTGNSRDTAKS
jgi:Restriction endonuclease